MGKKEKTILLVNLTVFGLAGLGLIICLWFFPANEYNFYPPCMTRKLFGIYCPGCGSGRALSCLIHGNIIHAFKLNPMFMLLIPLTLYWIFTLLAKAFELKIKLPTPGKYTLISIIVGIVLFTILRNIPHYPFNLLAPH